MSVVYTLFESNGKFRAYTYEEQQQTNELIGGLWKPVLQREWNAQYISNRRLPLLDTTLGTISWVDRPLKAK